MQAMIDAIKGGMGSTTICSNGTSSDCRRLPPLDEQRRIADFLDAETTRIDSA